MKTFLVDPNDKIIDVAREVTKRVEALKEPMAIVCDVSRNLCVVFTVRCGMTEEQIVERHHLFVGKCGGDGEYVLKPRS